MSSFSPPANATSRHQSVDDSDGLDVLAILQRQRWLIIFLTLAGFAGGLAYSMTATTWFKTKAVILINQKTAGLSGTSEPTDLVAEDTLSNHMELLRSRLIVGEAIRQYGLEDLESVKPHIEPPNDIVDYVIDRLEIVKGGDGSAKTARTLNVALTHTDREDSRKLLTAVLKRYEQFIVNEVEQVMGRAGELIGEAKNEIERDLASAEQEYLVARQAAPLFFQGENSSNAYQDRYRRLQDEMLDIDIKESTLRTRLATVQNKLDEASENSSPLENLDMLALIDSESLERLGVFASLQVNSANSAEFKAAMPAQAERARAEITHLMELNSERQRLTNLFGAGHPKVTDIENQIETTKRFLNDNDLGASGEMLIDDLMSPKDLLRAYVGFLNHDLTSLAERKQELELLAKDAEEKAKTLMEFEMKDMVLKKKIERKEALFDSVVTQLRDLDTASGLSGYLYEFLEIPRIGVKSWPKLPLCSLAGLMLGFFLGLLCAVGNEMRDSRFRSAAELDAVLQMPNLGSAGRLGTIRDGIAGLARPDSSQAESFRLGRTLLLPEIRSGKTKVIGFTSPMQGDGKSTFLSNFATSLSQVGLRVLVIDADLRRPSLHRYFNLKTGIGLYDVLASEATFDDVIQTTAIDGVSAISSGTSPRSPAEALQSERLDLLLQEARDKYDVVLVDLPPALAVSDPVVVLPRLDGGILVARIARVGRQELRNAISRVNDAGVNWLGCFVNAINATGEFEFGRGYYGYYQSDYTKSDFSGPRQKPALPSAGYQNENGAVSSNGAVPKTNKPATARSAVVSVPESTVTDSTTQDA